MVGSNLLAPVLSFLLSSPRNLKKEMRPPLLSCLPLEHSSEQWQVESALDSYLL